MVATAESERSAQPAEAASRVRFVCADLRSLRLGERFPLVVAPQNALGLLTSRADLESLVATVFAHLAPGGMFAFDVLNPKPMPSLSDTDAPHVLEPPRPVFAPHLRESRRARNTGVSSLRRWRLRLFGPAELDDALGSGGLVPKERYGNFDGKPFEPEDGLQVIVSFREP
jgi:hypothetical protein